MNQLQISEAAIENIQPLSARIDALNDLAWRLRYREKEHALQICLRTRQLSQTAEFETQPYQIGLATSLATSSFIHQIRYDLDESMNEAIQALTILQGFSLLPAASDARISIGWINLITGDFSTALEYALPALHIARELHDLERQAYTLDALGNIYCKSSDYDHAIENHHEALQIAEKIAIPEISMVIYNNLANTLFEMKRFNEALPYSLKSIELARSLGLLSEELIVISTVADILVGMKSFEEAETYLHDALTKYQKSHLAHPYVFMLIMFGLAGINLEQNKYNIAEPYLFQALETARQHDFKTTQMLCHQQLCAVYENTLQYHLALEHFKQFQALQVSISGKDMARKIALLKAEYRIELSRREAENFRNQNRELQHEIEERKRVEALLESLSIRDSLTNLFNRRQFSFLAATEFDRSIRYNHPLCVLMLDIDHFKRVNDQYGHQVGDQVLINCAKTIQTTLRDSSDIIGRYGGEEFIALLPEITSARAVLVSERLRKTINDLQHDYKDGHLSVTISIGISEFEGNHALVPSLTLDELINQADQALYLAKKNGRNRVEHYQPS